MPSTVSFILRGILMFLKTDSGKRALKIIIVGAGNVGATLIEQLLNEGNEIVLIDHNHRRIQELSSLYDILGIEGNGASYNIQMEAGIAEADLLIAVTDSDELNLLCCTVAKRFDNCAAIARVRTPDYSNEVGYLRDRLGLAMIINPDLESAREIARLFYLPSGMEVTSFAHGQAEIIKFCVEEKSSLDNVRISDFAQNHNTQIMICAVERDGEVSIPTGNFVIKSGDIVSFVAPRRNRKDFLKMIGSKTSPVKGCMIVGGGLCSFYLAK